jgi:uncharacterized membrane protein YbjE (DUF340 family)
MKNKPIKILIFSLLFFIACEKKEIPNSNSNNSEISLEQKPIILSDSIGNQISITYFAKGDEVAVKLKKDNVISELSAKGTNAKGEVIFSNEKFAWELMEDGRSGRLIDKEGKTNIYK